MELEMKYSIPGREIAEEIWNDPTLLELGDPCSRKKVVMKAVYFDTPDGLLSRNNVAFRVRSEDCRMVATLKWGGTAVDGFHARQEINVPVDGDSCFIATPKEIFKESEDGKMLIDLVGDRPLINLLETRFLRSQMRVRYGGSIMELAIDTGSIVTDNGECPIMEAEIELYAGDPEDIRAFGEKLAEKYGLTAQNESKLKRGLDMIA